MMFCDLLLSVLLNLKLTDIYQKLCKKSAVSFHDLRFRKTGNWLTNSGEKALRDINLQSSCNAIARVVHDKHSWRLL
jgi:hypothetical protein